MQGKIIIYILFFLFNNYYISDDPNNHLSANTKDSDMLLHACIFACLHVYNFLVTDCLPFKILERTHNS
jgi:hypothetical protein